MAKKKAKEQTAMWSILDPIDRTEPATEITMDSVIAFRNGLAKWVKDATAGSMRQTVAWRASIDLDHLARFLKGLPGSTITTSYQFKITPKHKKDTKRFMAMVKKVKLAKKKWDEKR